MQLDLATAEYIGAREQQQDLAAALPIAAGALLILADGLGGHESGAEASRIVVTTFKEAGAAGRFQNTGSRRLALREVLDLANARIAAGVDPSHGHRGMASTVVAAVVSNSELSWVSVGDSHLYIWRDGRLHKLNEDHSQAGLMVKSGQYQPGDPEVLAVKSVLVSALTGRKLEIVDLPQSSFRLEPGDVLMLASDGLNTLSDEEIERIIDDVRDDGSIKLSTTLLESVRSRRVERQDNTTVVVARVLAPVRAVAEAPVRRPELAQADAFDDSSEELTQRIVPESERERAGAAGSVPDQVSAQETELPPDGIAKRSALEADTKATDAKFNPSLKGPILTPRSARPEPPRFGAKRDEPKSAPLALGAAPADLPAEAVVLPPRRPLPTAEIPSVTGTQPRYSRRLIILVLVLLLVGGAAIAALKSDWLGAAIPGLGGSSTGEPASKVEAGSAAKVNVTPEPAQPPTSQPVPGSDRQPAAPSGTGIDAAPTVSPQTPPAPEAAATQSSAPSPAGPSGKAQADGEAVTPAPRQAAPTPNAGTPPLVEPERPAVAPPERNRSP